LQHYWKYKSGTECLFATNLTHLCSVNCFSLVTDN
jgi:hypothetical protein